MLEKRLKKFCKECIEADTNTILEHNEDDVIIKVEKAYFGYKVLFGEGNSETAVLETYCENDAKLKYEIFEYFGFEA